MTTCQARHASDSPFVGLADTRRTVLSFAFGLAVAVTLITTVNAGPLAGSAAMLGCFAVLVAVSTPRTDWLGWLLGAQVTLVAVIGWSTAHPQLFTAIVYAVAGGAFIALAGLRSNDSCVGVPWGALLLGAPVWFLGAMSSMVASHPVVALERALYGCTSCVAIAAVSRRGSSATVRGFAAACQTSVAVSIVSGSSWAYSRSHYVPGKADLVAGMTERFWGGPFATLHPNVLGNFAWISAVLMACDETLGTRRKLAAVGLASWAIWMTQARTAAIALTAGVVALAFFRATTGGKQLLIRAVVLLFAGLFLLAVTWTFLLAQRAHEGDVLTGRRATWALVVNDFSESPRTEQLLGDPNSTRGLVRVSGPEIPVDNAVLSLIHRGGLLSLACAVLGAILLSSRVVGGGRRNAQAVTGGRALLVASLLSAMTEETILFGAGWTALALIERLAITQQATPTGKWLSAGVTRRLR